MAEHHIDPWDTLRREELVAVRAAFEARPDFDALVKQAAERGYRRITITEQMDPGKADAYTWRGGVWVRTAGVEGQSK